MSRPRHVVLALLSDDRGRYLVAKRPIRLHQGGRWELPGGKVGGGEAPLAALARELVEELGVQLSEAHELMTWEHRYEDQDLRFTCYLCRALDPAAARPLESDELAWVTPAEALALDFPPGSAPVLRWLAEQS